MMVIAGLYLCLIGCGPTAAKGLAAGEHGGVQGERAQQVERVGVRFARLRSGGVRLVVPDRRLELWHGEFLTGNKFDGHSWGKPSFPLSVNMCCGPVNI